ncbi:hypothetical protein PAXRUDRAFT_833939 [Paxillus rubicundulus Ve08.2h10]|uniref:Unplaced genomic scaffold scaffold_1373, whole genome shotgun sequence n=1 Tax=Paxillus rubicundulus Ve08.2h10 TaxID=930991 RepID=A0A0D0CW64_9AGAM|nr:hypothetical protein PAXRUDRAFT_833939 [Paxillus rubicundulus Ve08.2h10]
MYTDITVTHLLYENVCITTIPDERLIPVTGTMRVTTTGREYSGSIYLLELARSRIDYCGSDDMRGGCGLPGEQGEA